jgi:hypothetical protein
MEFATVEGHAAHREGARDLTYQSYNSDRLVKAFILERSTTYKELNAIRTKVRSSLRVG